MLQVSGLNAVPQAFLDCLQAGGKHDRCIQLYGEPEDPWAEAASGEVVDMNPEGPSIFERFIGLITPSSSPPVPVPPNALRPPPPRAAAGISTTTIALALALGVGGLLLYKRLR